MDRLAHYSVIEKIGEGGMGEVFRARDERLKREVAVKVLPVAFVQDAERLGRFEREAQLLASLNHPNVAAIYGLERDGSQHCLVLELVPGEDLAQRQKRGPVPGDEASAIALQIATAVETAHELGIVHRDLKPSNVMLTPDGTVKVLDFGLAKAVQGDLSDSSLNLSQSPTLTGPMTGANVVLGTAAYMAPEQARGKKVDKRADVWAFGVILFEMLTGRPLFAGETVSDTLAAVLKTDPDWDRLPAATPPHVRALLARCLTRDPQLRLRDIGEARIVLGHGDDVGLPAREERGGTRWPALAAAAALALLVGGALGFLLKPAPSAAPGVPRVFALDAGPGPAVPSDPAISPDGAQVAYIRDRSIWIRDLTRLAPRHLERTEGVLDVFWSPDGQRLGYLTTDRVMTVDPAGGEPVVVAPTGESTSENTGVGGSWSAGGSIVYALGIDDVYRVSDRGGSPTVQVVADTSRELDLHEPLELPDGSLLVVPHRTDSVSLGSLEILAGDERIPVVTTPGHRIYRPVWSPTGHILYEQRTGNPGVWAVPWDLAGRRARGEPFLVYPHGMFPSVAADGTLAMVRGLTSERLQLVETDRTGTVLREIGEARPYDPNPALSPDGRHLAVIHTSDDADDVWIHDLERGTASRLTFTGGAKSGVQWSPDGRRVSYIVGSNAASMAVMVQRVDGTAGVDTAQAPSAGGGFVPDSDEMVFDVRTPETSWDLFVGRPGGEVRPLVQDAGWQYAAAVSPDGRYVAYMSRESGVDQVILRRFPDGSGKWQVSVDGGCWPRWNAAGDRILYARGDAVVEVAVQTADPPVLGRPEVVLTRPALGIQVLNGWAPGFSETGDGERFYFFRPADDDGGSTTMVLYENWTAAGP